MEIRNIWIDMGANCPIPIQPLYQLFLNTRERMNRW